MKCVLSHLVSTEWCARENKNNEEVVGPQNLREKVCDARNKIVVKKDRVYVSERKVKIFIKGAEPVFPCQFHSTGPSLQGKTKKLIVFITGLHNKPQGCGASVASAAGPFTTKKKKRQ
jgi:hypothetical protein